MDEIYSPVLHRINQALRWRAVHPTEPVPPAYEILTKYSTPPGDLVVKAQPYLSAVIGAADVKKGRSSMHHLPIFQAFTDHTLAVPPRQRGRKRAHRETEKPLSGLDVDALLGREKRARISPENAIPEFKQLLATTEELATIKDAATQMGTIIMDYIRHSVGDSGYGRAVEAIRVMREELTELEEPGTFNSFMRELKTKLLKGELGGERREMWWRIRANRLGLIDGKACAVSEVSEEDGKAVRGPCSFLCLPSSPILEFPLLSGQIMDNLLISA